MTLTDEQEAQIASGQDEHSSQNDRRHALVEWVVIIVVALVAALLIKTFAVQAFYIPSASMEPTLEPGDRVLVNKLSYDFHSLHIGDIVVFRRPPKDDSPGIDDLIKRVVALPGETISVSNCEIYINGKKEAQPWLPAGWQDPASAYCTRWPAGGCAGECLPNPYKVPPGYLFVMGDNRNDSYDSRYWGALPRDYIVGRAFVRMWPVGRIGLL